MKKLVYFVVLIIAAIATFAACDDWSSSGFCVGICGVGTCYGNDYELFTDPGCTVPCDTISCNPVANTTECNNYGCGPTTCYTTDGEYYFTDTGCVATDICGLVGDPTCYEQSNWGVCLNQGGVGPCDGASSKCYTNDGNYRMYNSDNCAIECGESGITPIIGILFELNDSTDVTNVGQTTDKTVYVFDINSNPVGKLFVEFSSAAGDVVIPNLTIETNETAGKAVMHADSNYGSDVSSAELMVPRTTGNPYHCPSAEIIEDVNLSCTALDMNPSYTTVEYPAASGNFFYLITNPGGGNSGPVPEFSTYALLAALVLVVGGFLVMRRKN